ncbi:MAG: FtsX-like permease family protein [Acidimicrobiales bacterium]|nr:FtsX-like permease family protein [Acidimicrobiales bacterium]
MFKATIKSLMAHKLRLALTALAVVLGVAFVSGTFVLTDTIKHTFNALFQQTSAGKDAVVRGVAPYGGNGNGDFNANRPLTPESLVATVRSTPGVTAADANVVGLVTLLNKSGKSVSSHAPTLAFSWLPDRKLSVLNLRRGVAPSGPDQMTIDNGTAKKQHFNIGDQVTVVGNQGPRQFTVVGITGFGSTDNLGGATVVTFDLPTVQQIAGKSGYVSEIDVSAVPGTPSATLLSAIGDRLPKGFEVVTGAEAAAQQANAVTQGLNQFNTILLVFAGIALFVGAFLIFNTFSILVGQRTRELALLRAIGASRRQINMSVLGEAAFTGLFGAAVGLGVGVGLAAGLYSLLSALGVDLPRSSLQFEARTAIVGLIVGTLVTLVSAVLPALRAGRIPPAAGLREDAVFQETSLRRRAVTGGAVFLVGALVLAVGLFASAGILAVGIGAALVFIGVAMLAPFAVKPLVSFLGRPLPALAGVTGQLGRENAVRNPRRTAATASALMVGLALVAAIATLGQSATASFNGLFDQSVKADYVLSAGGFTTVAPAAEGTLAAVPGITAVSGLSQAEWHLGRVGKQVTGIDPVAGPQVMTLDMVSGSAAALGRGEVLIDSTVAKNDHYRVGQVLPMGFVATGVRPVVIGGTFKTNQFLGNYVISSQLLAANVNQVRDQLIALRSAQVGPQMTAALQNALHSYGNVKVQTAAQFKSDQKKQLGTILAIVYALLGLSIVIALIGVVNTLALSVMERTREIGLLRAVGMQRRQLKRTIRSESLLVSVMGAILGLVLGTGLGVAVVSALGTSFITTIAIPVTTIVVVLILSAIFGVGAAVWPARRAAKLDVLEAIYTI